MSKDLERSVAMKKLTLYLALSSLILALWGCSAETPNISQSTTAATSAAPTTTASDEETEMYIAPAVLTAEELDILELINREISDRVFDFQVDDTVQSVHISAHLLKDGQWQKDTVGMSSRTATDDSEGRVLLDFDRIDGDYTISLQGNSDVTRNEVKRERLPTESTGIFTDVLEEKTEIVYEKEIPLVLQIVSSGGISAASVDSFYNPEELISHGYDKVMAVTILFSQKPLS